MMILFTIIIFILSFFLALKSLADLNSRDEGKKVVARHKTVGSIVFYKDKVVHYSSNSSESSSL